MAGVDDLTTRLEELIEGLEQVDEPIRGRVFELLDGIDTLHRVALGELARALTPQATENLRAAHPAISWLFDAYGVGLDERAVAEAALESIRPYIHSHGGRVDVLGVSGGVVSLRLAGACSGCTASAITLREGIETALRENMPSFARVEVEDDDAVPHAPPGATLLQIGRIER